jgi:hypothetical protein
MRIVRALAPVTVGVVVLLLTAPAHGRATGVAAPVDPLAAAADSAGVQKAQIIGWSEDGTRFAVRLFELEPEDDMGDEAPYCKGYIDHEGKRFRGSLTLLVYEGKELLEAHPIQEAEKCTKGKEAKSRLAWAKASFERLGVSLERKGTALTPRKKKNKATVKVTTGPGAPFEILYERKNELAKDVEGGMRRREKGAETLAMKSDDTLRILVKGSYDVTYELTGAGSWDRGLDHVALSHDGRTLVAVGYDEEGNMRGRTRRLFLMSVTSAGGK